MSVSRPFVECILTTSQNRKPEGLIATYQKAPRLFDGCVYDGAEIAQRRKSQVEGILRLLEKHSFPPKSKEQREEMINDFAAYYKKIGDEIKQELLEAMREENQRLPVLERLTEDKLNEIANNSVRNYFFNLLKDPALSEKLNLVSMTFLNDLSTYYEKDNPVDQFDDLYNKRLDGKFEKFHMACAYMDMVEDNFFVAVVSSKPELKNKFASIFERRFEDRREVENDVASKKATLESIGNADKGPARERFKHERDLKTYEDRLASYESGPRLKGLLERAGVQLSLADNISSPVQPAKSASPVKPQTYEQALDKAEKLVLSVSLNPGGREEAKNIFNMLFRMNSAKNDSLRVVQKEADLFLSQHADFARSEGLLSKGLVEVMRFVEGEDFSNTKDAHLSRMTDDHVKAYFLELLSNPEESSLRDRKAAVDFLNGHFDYQVNSGLDGVVEKATKEINERTRLLSKEALDLRIVQVEGKKPTERVAAAQWFENLLRSSDPNLDQVKREAVTFLRDHHVFTRSMKLGEAVKQVEKELNIPPPSKAARLANLFKATAINVGRKVSEKEDKEAGNKDSPRIRR